MNAASYDLHLHTCWSYDATAEPASYLRHAHASGMRALAITDHHVMDSLPEVQQAARAFPAIRLIPAAELTVTTSLGPIDLVCLGFAPALTPALQAVLDVYHQWQRDFGAALVRGMQALGFDWTQRHRHDLLESYRPRRTLALQGWTHVKNELQRDEFIRRGFIASDQDYGPLLGRARKAAGAPPYPAAGDVVPALSAAGVLKVIAHPHGYFAGADPIRMDSLCAECALDGIECAHPATPLEFTPRYREYCLRHGLVSTAGSDCHGEDDVAPLLGRHGGAEEWLDEVLARLDGRATAG